MRPAARSRLHFTAQCGVLVHCGKAKESINISSCEYIVIISISKLFNVREIYYYYAAYLRPLAKYMTPLNENKSIIIFLEAI